MTSLVDSILVVPTEAWRLRLLEWEPMGSHPALLRIMLDPLCVCPSVRVAQELQIPFHMRGAAEGEWGPPCPCGRPWHLGWRDGAYYWQHATWKTVDVAEAAPEALVLLDSGKPIAASIDRARRALSVRENQDPDLTTWTGGPDYRPPTHVDRASGALGVGPEVTTYPAWGRLQEPGKAAVRYRSFRGSPRRHIACPSLADAPNAMSSHSSTLGARLRLLRTWALAAVLKDRGIVEQVIVLYGTTPPPIMVTE